MKNPRIILKNMENKTINKNADISFLEQEQPQANETSHPYFHHSPDPLALRVAIPETPYSFKDIAQKPLSLGSFKWSTTDSDDKILFKFISPIDLFKSPSNNLYCSGMMEIFRRFKNVRFRQHFYIMTNPVQFMADRVS